MLDSLTLQNSKFWVCFSTGILGSIKFTNFVLKEPVAIQDSRRQVLKIK